MSDAATKEQPRPRGSGIEVGQKQDDFVAEYVSSPQWWWDLDVSGGEQIPDAPLLEKEVEE